MNAHTPFDANQDWTNPYCQNSSNDPMVDALLGNAYHVVRTVYCNLGNLKLIYDFLNQYGMVLGVQSEAELKALTTKASFARIYGKTPAGDRQVTDYLYVEGDRTGILPDDATATGSWIKVATSGSSGGGESSSDGGYIPWIYNSGSAIGGETTIRIPDETAGVPFMIVNGDWQTEGYDFEYDPLTFEIKFTTPLEQGDFVVVMRTGVPATPDNPNVSDWVTINWLYNQGAAVGGEQVIDIPYTFRSVPAVYKNGLRFYKGLTNNSYTIDSDNNRIILTEPLATNDRLIVQLGGEAKVLEIADHTIQVVARATNVKDSEVILSTDTTQVLNGKKVLYDVVTQRIHGLPTLPANVYINTVSNGQLTYSPGNITVTLLDTYQQQNTRELWRRSLAEAGLTLVDGSFEEGATVNSATDAVWHIAGGQCYIWDGALANTVSQKSTPTSTGGIGVGAWLSVGVLARFGSRAELVSYAPGNNIADGMSVIAGGLEYIRDSTATSIPDLLGFKPPHVATLDHWGAPIDGTSDTTPFAQLAANWMALSPENKIHEPNVITRKFTTQISTTGHMNWDAGNAHYIIDTGDTWLFAEGNANPSLYPLTADYVAGSKNLAVNLPNAPKRGDWVRIISNAVNPADRTRIGNSNKYRIQEYARVGAGSTTTNLVLDKPLQFVEGMDYAETAVVNPYSLAWGARVALVDTSKNSVLLAATSSTRKGRLMAQR
ncbi:tail spike protein [Escherichia phage U1G]|uniref:Tail spike TSP1/Gp66 N-terminal domain-containing protein n=1 Tax=Escherichia phage U1G TaxID=2853091 RepID=A0AAE7VJL9_9CAUD|nr:tail spike protein [Escherichia phage U1G]QXV71915.1 hypothetical protein [Escherichia phage U1G]